MTLQGLLPLPGMSSHISWIKQLPSCLYKSAFLEEQAAIPSSLSLCILSSLPMHSHSFMPLHTTCPLPDTAFILLCLTSPARPTAGTALPKKPFLKPCAEWSSLLYADSYPSICHISLKRPLFVPKTSRRHPPPIIFILSITIIEY